MTELGDLGLVKSTTAQVRIHGAVPMFKLYIINQAEAFFGFYPIAGSTPSASTARPYRCTT